MAGEAVTVKPQIQHGTVPYFKDGGFLKTNTFFSKLAWQYTHQHGTQHVLLRLEAL